MTLKITATIIVLFLLDTAVATPSPDQQQIFNIIRLIEENNNNIQSAKKHLSSSRYEQEGSGYFPNPIVKLNVFGSPIETRNGPQRFNIMVAQAIPWPSALRAEEQLATSMARLNQEQIEILLLDLKFKAKSIIYKFAELSEKLESKNKMIVTLNNLSKVVLGRLKLGAASQAEISRINIEVARLSQTLRLIEAKMVSLQQKLKSMAGGKDITHLLPKSIDKKWGQLEHIDPSKVDISSHPLIRLAKTKISSAQAGLDQAEAKRLPQFGASVSWFQIDEPNSAMAGTDAGKDAWAIGASVSIPIWSKKYESMEYSQIAKRSAAEHELSQQELDLRTGLQSVYEDFRSTSDVSSMFRSDILPQAIQALKSDRESYTQGNVPFERVIEHYIRVIKFEDQLIESQVKQATLRAAIEKLVGRSL